MSEAYIMVHVYGWSVRFMWVIRGESVCQG